MPAACLPQLVDLSVARLLRYIHPFTRLLDRLARSLKSVLWKAECER